MGFGMTELLVILAIVVLVFGPKRLKTIGADLGNAIKGFRKAVTEDEKGETQHDARVIEGEVSPAPEENSGTKQNTNV